MPAADKNKDRVRTFVHGIAKHLTTSPRPVKQVIVLLTDCGLLSLAAWLAFSLRLGEWYLPTYQQALLILSAPLIALPIFIRTGLYRSVVRYVGEQALWTVVKAMTLATLVWATLAFMTQMTGISGIPRAIPLLYWLLGVVFVSSSRFLARWLLQLPKSARKARYVVVYGAGNAGRQLAASLRQDGRYFCVGFLDDNDSLVGKDINGLRVYSPRQLDWLIEHFGVADVIVTLPNISRPRRLDIVSYLEAHPVTVRILPAMADIAAGHHLVNLIREIEIMDLLGRDPVPPDTSLLGQAIKNKAVLVTGAGGSIGSELCRQIAAQKPAKLVMLDVSEFNLYQIHQELKSSSYVPNMVPILGSVLNRALICRLMKNYSIDTVYHSAAYKHVHLAEMNILETVRNNIFGTNNVASMAIEHGVSSFVLVSTDKAVDPTNIMGATKRWAELLIYSLAEHETEHGNLKSKNNSEFSAELKPSKTKFSTVRFGNVLGSSGSVIPLFKEQIKAGGPVTVTHPDVCRYFMSIKEAVELIIQASTLTNGKDIFVLDMGEPIKIIDLAKNMIRLSGHTLNDYDNPEGDIAIEITGLQPGEKLYEKLTHENDSISSTLNPKISRTNNNISATDFLQMFDRLVELVNTENLDGIIEILFFESHKNLYKTHHQELAK